MKLKSDGYKLYIVGFPISNHLMVLIIVTLAGTNCAVNPLRQ